MFSTKKKSDGQLVLRMCVGIAGLSGFVLGAQFLGKPEGAFGAPGFFAFTAFIMCTEWSVRENCRRFRIHAAMCVRIGSYAAGFFALVLGGWATLRGSSAGIGESFLSFLLFCSGIGMIFHFFDAAMVRRSSEDGKIG